MIGKLREEVDVIKAESLKWKEGMDRFAVEKEVARAELSSTENQLQSMKEKSSVQGRRIEEVEARLASELAKAESDAKKDIHARGFDLTEEIKRAKELEADTEALASDDDDDDDNGDDDGSKRGSESGEDPDGEETALGDI
ncbi:histone chaperone asf1-like [Nicotiana tomentosiformis]|uniref:histone chaperone asf1-like n=1 Tax=Nicotiana tomentosiformis TaxID=4098 RepID=UPI00388CEB94